MIANLDSDGLAGRGIPAPPAPGILVDDPQEVDAVGAPRTARPGNRPDPTRRGPAPGPPSEPDTPPAVTATTWYDPDLGRRTEIRAVHLAGLLVMTGSLLGVLSVHATALTLAVCGTLVVLATVAVVVDTAHSAPTGSTGSARAVGGPVEFVIGQVIACRETALPLAGVPWAEAVQCRIVYAPDAGPPRIVQTRFEGEGRHLPRTGSLVGVLHEGSGAVLVRYHREWDRSTTAALARALAVIDAPGPCGPPSSLERLHRLGSLPPDRCPTPAQAALLRRHILGG